MYQCFSLSVQRLLNHPSIIIIAVLSVFIVNIASIHLTMDAQANQRSEQHYHYSPWFSSKKPSLVLNLSLFHSPRLGSFPYDWTQSTEYNYRSENADQWGIFQSIRQRLDHSYHQHYSLERQALQDSIIEGMLRGTRIVDAETGQECSIPVEPWIMFTAGVYGGLRSVVIPFALCLCFAQSPLPPHLLCSLLR